MSSAAANPPTRMRLAPVNKALFSARSTWAELMTPLLQLGCAVVTHACVIGGVINVAQMTQEECKGMTGPALGNHVTWGALRTWNAARAGIAGPANMNPLRAALSGTTLEASVFRC